MTRLAAFYRIRWTRGLPLLLLVVGACAPEPIRHTPFASLAPLTGQTAPTVALTVVDARPAGQSVFHLTTVRAGTADAYSGPEPTLDPPNQLRSVEDAVAEAMSQRGLTRGTQGRRVQIGVLDLHACSRWDVGIPFFVGGLMHREYAFRAASRAVLRVTVHDPSGRTVLVRDYEAGAAGPDNRPNPAARRLNEALTAAATAIVQDEAFIRALDATAASSEVTRPGPIVVGDFKPSCSGPGLPLPL